MDQMFACQLSLVLTTRAARDVLSFAPAAVGGGNPEGGNEAETRERGAQALAALLPPRQAFTLYLRNGGPGNDSEQVIELRVATDAESAPNTALSEKLGGKSLALVGTEKQDRYSGDGQFVLFGARAIPDVYGQKDAYSLPAQISFGEGGANGGAEGGLPAKLLAALAKMPEPRALRESVQRRLADWHRYLGVLERTAKARQFSVTYKAFRRGPVESHLIFTLDGGREPVAWDKLRSVVDEPLEVRERRGLARTEDAPAGGADEDDGDDWLLGSVVDCSPERGELRLALDEDALKLLEHRTVALPRTAALVYKASGDLAQVRRLKFGLELLEQGYGENPRLSEFMFEAARAHRPPVGKNRITLDQAELLQPRLNAGQHAAVEGALNAPDLFLIQGPPGTGKTTVIAEICYQNALRGQRTLIASQANLAVDNALSRLVHHPRIRALRRGRADRVEVEGAPFLEDKVVGTWLAKTAESCERDLSARREGIRRFEDLLQNKPRLETLAASLRSYQATRPKQAADIAGLEAQIPILQQRTDQTARALTRRHEAQASLARLQAGLGDHAPPAAGNGHGGPREHANLDAGQAADEVQPEDLTRLERLQLHDHAALQQLRDNVGELNRALDSWEPELPEPAPVDEAAPGATQPGFADTLRLAAAARQRAKIQGARLAQQRAQFEVLHKQGQEWLKARARQQALALEHTQLSAQAATLSEQRARLEGERDALQAKQKELAAFDAEHVPVLEALRHWVAALAQRGATGGLATPPDEFGSPLGREIWSVAGETAQLHKLSALAHEVRTNHAAAERMADLAVRASDTLESLLPLLRPGAAPAEGDVRPQGRRALPWRRSALRGLVALDTHGELHPAHGADAAWAHVDAELEPLRQLPARWQRLTGAEQRRQQALALWAQHLRAAAEDFARRRAELEALERHRATRLSERTEASGEALQAAVAQAANVYGPQAEQRLAEVSAELAAILQTQPGVTTRLSEVIQQLAILAESQARHAADLQAARESLGDARRTRAFQHLLRQVGPDAGTIQPTILPSKVVDRVVEDWSAAWSTAANHLDEALAALAATVQAVDSLNALRQVAADLEQDTARMEQAAARAKQAWQAGQQEVASARERLRLLDEAQAQELAWWTGLHAALPQRLRAAAPPDAAPESLETVEAMLAASHEWQAELDQQQAYLKRAEGLVTEWVKRLRAANPRDSADLKQIYIDNANVIGITCVQAGAYQFSRAYRNFDCVIIDEVSKATPPELLLPMLKGARVVLVGDHKQLPPMIGPETLADLAIDMEVPKAELDHLERSLFKELFEGAPPELRVMLTEQYRMHPQIMEAINQFYDGKLEAGIVDPDKARAHGLDLPWLRPDNHILWINTPTEGPFVEQKIGTTFMNAGEIDVILRLVKALDTAWAPQVAAGRPPKEVGVITFYGAQVRELKARLVEPGGQFKNLRLRVGTVDRFQGMERPIIIASLVRNNAQGSVGFARKPERVNVAFSRAQELLVIVGSRELFTERARDAIQPTILPGKIVDRPGEGQVRAMYGRVAEVVTKAGGLRRTTDVSNDFKR